MTDEKKTLTPEEFSKCAQAILAIQSTCEHRRTTGYAQSMGGKYFTIYQCMDCAMYNPGGYGFSPSRS